MKYLWTKFRRDLLKLFPQFISVFMMALLSITIFSGFESVWTGMEHQSEKFYDDGNLADIWLYGSNLDSTALEKIKSLKGVKEATNSMSIKASVNDGSESASDVNLITINDVVNQKPVVLEGEDFNIESNGIWLDKTYADKHDLELGDTITLKYGESPDTAMIVKGLVMSPEFIYYTGSATETMPNPEKHGYGFISEKQMSQLTIIHSRM